MFLSFKAIVNLISYEKMDLNSIWKESLHYPIYEKLLLFNKYFLSKIVFQFLFHFRGQRRLLIFNDVLFAQKNPIESTNGHPVAEQYVKDIKNYISMQKQDKKNYFHKK